MHADSTGGDRPSPATPTPTTPTPTTNTPAANPRRTDAIWRWSSSILLILGCCWIVPYGDFRQVGTVPPFWVGIGIMSVGFGLSRRLSSVSLAWFWGVAVAARLILIPMYPGDDIWRYLWEGYIQLLGFSPYHLAPDAAALMPHHTDWWPLINHPDTSAIYPPVTQWGFRLLAAITPSVWLFKVGFILADLGVCWALRRRFGSAKTLLYAWNPLILYSFAGGGHYDSWFVLPVVLAWLVFDATDDATNTESPPRPWKRWLGCGLLLGVSVAVKWISLPLVAFVGWQAVRRRRLGLGLITLACAALPLVLTALPFCQVGSCPLIPVSSGFVSYGRSADLIPHGVQLIWPPSLKENWLYGFPLGLAVLWLLGRSRTFQQFSEWYFGILLVLSPVVHSWYFAWLVPFAVASRNQGIQWVSMSSFVYFVLQHRIAQDGPWQLTVLERSLLWLPFIGGWLWTITTSPASSSTETSVGASAQTE